MILKISLINTIQLLLFQQKIKLIFGFSLNGVSYSSSISRTSFGRYAAARPPCSMANVSTIDKKIDNHQMRYIILYFNLIYIIKYNVESTYINFSLNTDTYKLNILY